MTKHTGIIKKLAVVAAFTGSLIVGVPSASASPFLCMQQYNAAIIACDGNGPCLDFANLQYTDCLKKDANVEM